MLLKGNKGEWSEVYALLKLLLDKKLFVSDENLNTSSTYYPIVSVIRDENNGRRQYKIQDDKINIVLDGIEYFFKASRLAPVTRILFKKIKESNKTFFVGSIDSDLSKLKVGQLKAKSSKKTDIIIKFIDFHTSSERELGFSVKSQIGGLSTLLNASRQTNLLFRLNNQIPESELSYYNNYDISDLASILDNEGYEFIFVDTNTTFINNLRMIDSDLPLIMSEALKAYTIHRITKLEDTVDYLNDINPCNYPIQAENPFYSYKIKRLLFDIAVGMMPSKAWLGDYDATGGYLVVKEDGNLVSYHLFNRNEFESFLLSNTKFETPSTTRHNFGQLYNEGDKTFIKINMQIRFVK